MTAKTLFVVMVAAAVLCLSAESEAKRIGGGRSVGTAKPSAGADAGKVPATRAAEAPSAVTTPGSLAARAVGAAAGAAAARAIAGDAAEEAAAGVSPAVAPPGESEAARKVREDSNKRLALMQKQYDEERASRRAEERKAEAAAKAAEAAERRREQQEAQQLAALEEQKRIDRERIERESRCVIKPVMTDAEIDICKDR